MKQNSMDNGFFNPGILLAQMDFFTALVLSILPMGWLLVDHMVPEVGFRCCEI
jgi:hypothetical protein